jgi:DMSO/TMAO reductase YedYZ heme-binding membrane subunit
MTTELWWYTARASGLVAWTLLTASVVWGLCLSTRLRPLGARANWMLDLHRFLGGLATLFVGVHIASIMSDSYVHFTATDVLVPFAASWHPERIVWGVVALYLLLAVELTSLARKKLPPKLWRTVHMLSLPLFATATVHFVATGTDAGAAAALAAIVTGVSIVAFLTARRLTPDHREPRRVVPRNAAATTRLQGGSQ